MTNLPNPNKPSSNPNHAKEPVNTTSEALGAGIVGFILLGGMGTMLAYFPDPKYPSNLVINITWMISLIASICIVRKRLRPSWWAEFGVVFSLANLLLVAAIHTLSYFISNWIWFLPLLIVYLTAWALPIINSKLAKFLYTEQNAPQTGLGKVFLRIALLFSGIAGPVGAAIGLGSSKILHGRGISILIVGVLAAAVAIGFAQHSAYELWAKHRWIDNPQE